MQLARGGFPYRFCAVAALGLYLFVFRVNGLQENFAMLGEQVRDWSVAQRSFDNLPWIGPRSVNSGLDIGPVYYRFLWLSRVIVGPVDDNLPHTGGWATAGLQTAADLALFLALWRGFQSGWLAAAVVVVAATAPLDAHLSSTIWNPPVAVAFAKFATAALLWSDTQAISLLLAIACAVLAVQAHFTGVLVAVPVIGCALWYLWRIGKGRTLAVGLFTLFLASATWGVPYALDAPIEAAPAPGDGASVASLKETLLDPDKLRPAESSNALATALEFIFGQPFSTPWIRWVILGAAIATLFSRNLKLIAVGAAPLAIAIPTFALWQGPFGETYWFLVVAPAAAICIGTTVSFTRKPARVVIVASAVLFVVILQPARAQMTWHYWRTPQYGVVVKGSRAMLKGCGAVRLITTSFAVPATMDVYFVYSLLGGKLDAEGAVATIEEDGTVRCAR